MDFNVSKVGRIGLSLVAFLVTVILLRLGEAIFVPLIIAFMLAAILWPAASWLHKRLRLPWYMACFVAITGLIILNLTVFIGFAIAVPRMVQDLPGPGNEVGQKQLYVDIRTRLYETSPFAIREGFLPEDPADSQVFRYIQNLIEGGFITRALVTVVGYFQNVLWQGILIVFILLFVLLEGNMLSKRVKEIFGTNVITQGQVGSTIAQISGSIRSYLVWRTLINIWLGLLVGACYSVLGLRQPWTWALLTMVLGYIPYIGTIIAGFPPVLDAFAHTTPLIALAVLVGYIIVVTIEGYIIVPMLMGRSMDLNATTVMLSCLFWDLVWGVPGLFLAMPLMAAVKAVCTNVPEWRAWGNLMGTEEGYQEFLKRERIERLGNQLENNSDKTQLMDDGEYRSSRKAPPNGLS